MEEYYTSFIKEIKSQIINLIRLLFDLKSQSHQKLLKNSLEKFELFLEKEFHANNYRTLLEYLFSKLLNYEIKNLYEIEKKIDEEVYSKLIIHINLIRKLGFFFF
jgi:hypothetical protein